MESNNNPQTNIEELTIIESANADSIKPMRFIERMLNIIFEPRKAFESIIENPRLLAPIIFVIVSLFTLIVPMAPIIEDYKRSQIEKIYGSETFLKSQNQITKENADSFIDKTMKITKVVIYFTPIQTFLMLLLQTVFYYLLFKILRGIGNFKQTFAVFLYTYIIDLLGAIVRTINAYVSGKADITNSLGLVLGDDKMSWFFNFINAIDFFSIWSLIIAAIGLSMLHKLTFKKTCIAVFVPWIVYVAAMASIITYQANTYYNQYGVTI